MNALPAIDYAVRRSPRARRVRVRVDPDGGVEVVLPRDAPARAAASAVVELRPWIERRLREAAVVRAEMAARAGLLPYRGEELTPVPEPGRTRAHRRGHELLVPAWDPGPAIERWYRRRARCEADPLLAAAGAALGVRCTSLTIRGQRTRWGSCSSSGAVSLNWRLLLGPPEVLEYVVWHEACHLVVADHSRAFWMLLEHHLPGYRAPRRWLREKGALLTLSP